MQAEEGGGCSQSGGLGSAREAAMSVPVLNFQELRGPL